MEPYRYTNTKNINACSMIFLRTVHSNISNHNNDNNTKDDKTAAPKMLRTTRTTTDKHSETGERKTPEHSATTFSTKKL